MAESGSRLDEEKIQFAWLLRIRTDQLQCHGIPHFYATIGVPSQALCNEIHEQLVITFERKLKGFCSGSSSSAFAIDRRPRIAGRVEKELLTGASFDNMLIRYAKNFHYASKLLQERTPVSAAFRYMHPVHRTHRCFILAREDRHSRI